jgi:hypothetical protein
MNFLAVASVSSLLLSYAWAEEQVETVSLATRKDILCTFLSNFLSYHVLPALLFALCLAILQRCQYIKIKPEKNIAYLFLASIFLPLLFSALNVLLSTILPRTFIHHGNRSFHTLRIYLGFDIILLSLVHICIYPCAWSNQSIILCLASWALSDIFYWRTRFQFSIVYAIFNATYLFGIFSIDSNAWIPQNLLNHIDAVVKDLLLNQRELIKAKGHGFHRKTVKFYCIIYPFIISMHHYTVREGESPIWASYFAGRFKKTLLSIGHDDDEADLECFNDRNNLLRKKEEISDTTESAASGQQQQSSQHGAVEEVSPRNTSSKHQEDPHKNHQHRDMSSTKVIPPKVATIPSKSTETFNDSTPKQSPQEPQRETASSLCLSLCPAIFALLFLY